MQFQQFQPNASTLRSFISRRMQISFVVGLLLGIMLGWLFSGVVSAVMRFGLIAVLLIPLILALMFWWRVRTVKPQGEATVMTWSTSGLPPMQDDLFEQMRRDQQRSQEQLDDVVIDLDDIRRERKP